MAACALESARGLVHGFLCDFLSVVVQIQPISMIQFFLSSEKLLKFVHLCVVAN